MRLSELQKYILLECYNKKGFKLQRQTLVKFYNNQGKAKHELQTKVITGSIENLIDKGFLIGYGIRTQQKWFIKTINLTQLGVKQAGKILTKQQKLPLKK